jgi:hypothetical protein
MKIMEDGKDSRSKMQYQGMSCISDIPAQAKPLWYSTPFGKGTGMIYKKQHPHMHYSKELPFFSTLNDLTEPIVPSVTSGLFILGNGADKKWQLKAFDELKDANKFILKAVPGAGKSFLALCLELDKVSRCGYNKKALPIVPQKHIANSFRNPCINSSGILIKDKQFPQPSIDYDFCDSTPEKRKGLKEYLLTPVKDLRPVNHERFDHLLGITTHQNFIGTWMCLTPEEKRIALKDLILFIDECHHVCFDEKVAEMTNIGQILTEMLDINEPSCEIGLMTATYFRNDKKEILKGLHKDEFTKYVLRWDEYYPTLGIKDFTFDFVIYKEDPLDLICRALMQEPDHFHLVILPHTGDAFRIAETKELYYSRFQKIFPDYTILDLVEPNTQDANFRRLNANPSQYHVVLACDLFNEGTDWPPCDRLHNAAYSSDPSLPRLAQIIGRTLRKYEGKDSIVIVNYVHTDPEEDIRSYFTDHFNALMVSMMIDEMFRPIELPALPRTSKAQEEPEKVSLIEILDDNKYVQFIEELTLKCESLGVGLKDPQLVKGLCRTIAISYWDPKYAEKHNVSLDSFITAACAIVLRAKALTYAGGMHEKVEKIIPMDLSVIREEFDKIWLKDTGNGDLIFGTMEPLSDECFKDIREVIDRRLTTNTEDNLLWAETHAFVSRNALSSFRKQPDSSPAAITNLLGVEVKTPHGRGRVINQTGDKCEVRVYKLIEDYSKRIFLKRKGDLYAYRGDIEAWIPKPFLTTPLDKLSGKIREGLISDKQLLDSKKAFDIEMPIVDCKP